MGLVRWLQPPRRPPIMEEEIDMVFLRPRRNTHGSPIDNH